MALDYEEKYYKQGIKLIVGVDEAGRGPLLGPVVAGAVILPPYFKSGLIDDSKKLSAKKRDDAYKLIVESALSYGVGVVSAKEIDEINILKSSILAMHRAIERLVIRPELFIIDGNKFTAYQSIPHTCVIKGDGKYMSIAAASILAKTYRDDYMRDLHKQYPVYNWDVNKGYPTKKHRQAILNYGVSPYHRKTFRLLPE